jgi:hypothetical protein
VTLFKAFVNICALDAISRIPGVASAHKRTKGINTESIDMTRVGITLTFININTHVCLHEARVARATEAAFGI